MTEKIYKPKACKQCPVAHITKNKFECGVSMGKVRGDITKNEEMYNIWRRCPLQWDTDAPPPKKLTKKENNIERHK